MNTNTKPFNTASTDNTVEATAPADITTAPIADVQALIARADTKASILFGIALAALTGGTALAGKAHLSGFALAGAVLTACFIAAALVLLGAAIRPAIGGNQGFLRWANMPNVEALFQEMTSRDQYEREDDHLEHLWLLARSARRKYLRVRLAVDLLGLGLASAGLTAILTGLGW